VTLALIAAAMFLASLLPGQPITVYEDAAFTIDALGIVGCLPIGEWCR